MSIQYVCSHRFFIPSLSPPIPFMFVNVFQLSPHCSLSPRLKNAMRNPWKNSTSWPLSIWRTWSRCLSSGSSLKTNASASSKSCCWRLNSTWISPPITGESQGCSLPSTGQTGNLMSEYINMAFVEMLEISGILYNIVSVDSRQSTTRWKTQSLLLMLRRTWNGSGPIKAPACQWTGPSLRYYTLDLN